MKRTIYLAMGVVVILGLSAAMPSWAQTKNRLVVEIEPLPEAGARAKQEIERIGQRKITQYLSLKLPDANRKAQRDARREYVDNLTLEQFVNSITPKSREWLENFFDNMKHKTVDNFTMFFEKHKQKKLRDIRKLIKESSQVGKKSRKRQSSVQLLASCAATGEPTLSDITDSKLIRKDVYDCQKRDLISTTNQSLYFRGRNSQGTPPYFPDYPNTYCGKCCGPAAGQSILEWFNVPVRKPDGTLLTSTNNIQKRLATLMETEDGIDYTHPDDLARTLWRDEYVGFKGYCYKDGGGIFSDVDYMLSIGTPVILLIAEDSWAHYVTLYGYNKSSLEYYVANDVEFDRVRLGELWDFDNTSWTADGAYALTDVRSNTLFSYSNSGCDKNWSYQLVHLDIPIDGMFDNSEWTKIYYQKFINDYVTGLDEQGISMNFFGYAIIQSPGGLVPVVMTLVSNGERFVRLSSSSQNIINERIPASGVVTNNSLNRSMNFEVRVDKRFLETYEDVHAGFKVMNENGTTMLDRYGPYKNRIDVSASASDPKHYVFRLTVGYREAYRSVAFFLHGGFRKASWSLEGCWKDTDGDLICDEYDDDDDNDGIEDGSVRLQHI